MVSFDTIKLKEQLFLSICGLEKGQTPMSFKKL